MFVFELSFEKVEALAALMDVDGSWEDLAGAMRDPATLVLLLRQAQARGQSPTTQLLRLYGSRGHPLENLAKLLARIRHVRALTVLRDILEPRLFAFLLGKAETGASAGEVHSDRSTAKAASTSNLRLDIPPLSKKVSAGSQDQSSTSLTSQASTSDTASTSKSVASNAGLQNTLRVLYQELRAATKDFAQENLIGKGGYGMVYKGTWKHNQVAVKRIISRHKSSQPNSQQASEAERERVRQSLSELKTLGIVRHDHILPLYAFSLDGPEPLLLYQLMLNGSLEDRLLSRVAPAYRR